MKIISAVAAFFSILYLSMAIFLPKVLELSRGERAGMYSNIWLLATMVVAATFAFLIFKLLERREERRRIF